MFDRIPPFLVALHRFAVRTSSWVSEELEAVSLSEKISVYLVVYIVGIAFRCRVRCTYLRPRQDWLVMASGLDTHSCRCPSEIITEFSFFCKVPSKSLGGKRESFRVHILHYSARSQMAISAGR